MKIFYLILTIITFTLSSVYASGVGDSSTITMKFATFSAKKDRHPSYTPYEVFVTEVKKNLDISVEFFFGGQLGSPDATLNQALRGTIQGTEGSEGVISPIYKDVAVFSIPYLFYNREVAWKVLDGSVGKKIQDDFVERTGLRPLAWLENGGFRHFSNDKKQIKSASDMQGLKIRVQNAPLYINLVRNLGASPTPIAWNELYTSLQTGVVDGQENAVPTFLFAKLEEVQKYLVLDGHVYSISALLVNEQWYQSLPATIQETLQTAARAAALSSRELSIEREKEGLQMLSRSNQVQVYNPSKKEKDTFKNATQEGAIQWLRTYMDNPSLVDEIISESERVEKELLKN